MQCKGRDSAREIQNFDVDTSWPVSTHWKTILPLLQSMKPFPILADPSKEMVDAYGALMGVGFANRWTYYISADGTILKIDKETNAATAGRDLVQTMNDLGFPKN